MPTQQDSVDLIKNIAQLVLAPVCVVLLELSALYGLVCPYNGRKLFANLERFKDGGYVSAPCFQPLIFGDKKRANEAENELDLCTTVAF